MIKTITGKNIRAITKAPITQFKRWLKDGLKEAMVEEDEYDAHEFYTWYKTNVYRPMLREKIGVADNGEEVDMDIQAHRSRYERARAEKYQIRATKLRDKYVTDIEAKVALYEVAELLGNILEELPSQIAKVAQGKVEDDMLMKIDVLVRELLNKQSKEGEAHA